MSNTLGFLNLILGASGIRNSTKDTCKDCGKPNLGFHSWPGFSKPLPITGCVECCARNDAKIYSKTPSMGKEYFIGDLSCYNQQEREEYMKAFNNYISFHAKTN